MKTNKSRLFVMLALVATLVLSLSCLFITACGKEAVKQEIKWEYDAKTVTISAEGYSELPTELAEGTEFKFTVTPVEGYSATVTGATKDGDGYKFTVGTRTVTVKVTATKTVNDIEVEVLKDVVYFEDNEVDKTSLKVTAKFALGDEVVTDYTITYTNGNAFSEGDESFTVNYGGKTKVISITKVQAPQDFGNASLEVDADGNPVMVVTGQYNMEGTEAERIAAVEDFFKECLERTTWVQKEYEAKATFDEDGVHFTLRLTIKEWTATPTGHHYYFRYAKGGVVADGQNLSCGVSEPTCAPDANNDLPGSEYYGEPQTNADGIAFYIGKCENWQGCVMIIAIDATAPIVEVNSLDLKNESGVVTLTYTGTSKNMTSEDFATFDFDYEDSESVKTLTFTVVSFDEETGNFVISANVTDLPVGTNWLHVGGGNLSGEDKATAGTSVEVGGKTYSFAYSEYNCWQIVVA